MDPEGLEMFLMVTVHRNISSQADSQFCFEKLFGREVRNTGKNNFDAGKK